MTHIPAASRLRLGVNIDHVATIRNARGGNSPDPVRAALMAQAAGADGITAHLREDRRHIVDHDIARLMEGISVPLNFEMAATAEMQAIALRHRPHAVCIVPERREERTTEGGLDVAADTARLRAYCAPLVDVGCRISLFIGHDPRQIEAALQVGAPVVEFHVGRYCDLISEGQDDAAAAELQDLTRAVRDAHSAGIEVHCGHGITYDTVAPFAAMPQVRELNIGHFLIGEAIFVGLEVAVTRMRACMDAARAGVSSGGAANGGAGA